MTNEEKTLILTLRKQNLTYAAIAEKVGIPTNTVKTFCNRNAEKLKHLDDGVYCKNCGAKIVKTSKARPRLFCCDKCKQTWWNKHRAERVSAKMIPHICSTCGKPFMDYGGANRKYCSQACYRERGGADGE